MGFGQYKQSDWLTFYDLPEGGAVGNITHATNELHKNFRTGKQEMKVTLYFKEWKPCTMTNPNYDTLEACFPHLDHTTIGGQRVWLMPVELEVGGEIKKIVRIDQPKTMQMLPDPTLNQDQGVPAGEDRDQDAPPPDDNIPF